MLGDLWERFLRIVPGGKDAVSPHYSATVSPGRWTDLHNSNFITNVSIRSDKELQNAAKSMDYVLASDAGVKLAENGAAGTGSLVVRPQRTLKEEAEGDKVWDVVWEEAAPGGLGHSSYSAEIQAAIRTLKKAVFILLSEVKHDDNIQNQNDNASTTKRVLLVTDSLSALVHLSSFRSRSDADESFFEALNDLCKLAHVTLRHVKSHIGISLNERADALASEGLREQIDRGEDFEKVGPKHVKEVAKALAREVRLEELETTANVGGSKCRWYLDGSRDAKGKKLKLNVIPRRYSNFRSRLLVGLCPEVSTADYGVELAAGPSTCAKCARVFEKSWELVQHFMLDCESTEWCRGGDSSLYRCEQSVSKLPKGIFANEGFLRRLQIEAEGRESEKILWLASLGNERAYGEG